MNILYNSGNLVHSNDNEKLYLNDKGVSVNNYLLEQHQVEALRFLFEQFDKKSPGAVVNFPQSCGKAHTVAIFLNAVSNKLKDPVLILCKDISEMKYWKEILNKCSSYIDDEIAIDFYNPYTKMKKVFLKSKEIPPSYTQRHWSVVIIKHNTQMFKFPVTADFKIFICSTDLKKDYAMLSHVHTWLYPKRKVNIPDFVAKENCPKERFKKSVQLDLLLEEFAIRRYINLVPFQTSKNNDKAAESEKIIEKADASVQVDRKRHIKNKDPTGTKIKKSRIASDDDTVLNTTTNPNVVLANKETRSNNENAISMNDQMENKVSGDAAMLINTEKVNNERTISKDYMCGKTDPSDSSNILNGFKKVLNSNQNVLINAKITNGQNNVLMNDVNVNQPHNNYCTINNKKHYVCDRNRPSANQNSILIDNVKEKKPDIEYHTINMKKDYNNPCDSPNVSHSLKKYINSNQNVIINDKICSSQNVILMNDGNEIQPLINYYILNNKNDYACDINLTHDSSNVTNSSKKTVQTNPNSISINNVEKTPDINYHTTDIKKINDPNVILINNVNEIEPLTNYNILNNKKDFVKNKSRPQDSPNVTNSFEGNMSANKSGLQIGNIGKRKPYIKYHTINIEDDPVSDKNKLCVSLNVSNSFKKAIKFPNVNIVKKNTSANKNCILIDKVEEKPTIYHSINMKKNYITDINSPRDSLNVSNKSKKEADQNVLKNDIIISNENVILVNEVNKNKPNINNHTINLKKDSLCDKNRQCHSPTTTTSPKKSINTDQNIISIDSIDESRPNDNHQTIITKIKLIDTNSPRDAQNVTNTIKEADKNVILINDDKNTPYIDYNKINMIKKHESDLNSPSNSTNQNIILINDDEDESNVNYNTINIQKEHESDLISPSNSSNQNIIVINDDEDKPIINYKINKIKKEHISDWNSPLNSPYINNTSNQNIIVINDVDENKPSINENTDNIKDEHTSYWNISRDSPNVILINDDETKPNINNNIINSMIEEHIRDKNSPRDSQIFTNMSNKNENFDDNINKTHQNLILIKDEDDNKLIHHTNNLNKKYLCYKNSPCDDSPIFINDDSDGESGDDCKIDIKKYNCDNIDDHKSAIVDKSINPSNDSLELDVESFIRDQKPIDHCDIHFNESLDIDNNSQKKTNEIYVNSKEFLQKKLIESLDLDDYKKNLNVLDKSQIKEESTEPLEFDNASNVNLNEIKDLRKQLFESLGFESESLLENNNSNVMLVEHTFSSVHFDDNVEKENSTESLCFKSGSNVDIPNDLQNKNILQKNLLESLGLNRDNDKVEINKKISVGQNEALLQKQPIESCPEDMQVEIKKELNDDLNKEAQSFSLGLGDKKGEIRNELNDDQNKKMLQKKLIESLGLSPDDVQFEMNKEISISDDQNRKMLQKQLIDSLGLDEEDENDEIKKESNDDQNMNEEDTLEIKIEPDCDTKTKENVNSVGGNKSGESDKDLDLKISLMEERALEKFKGSLLDSLF